MKWEWNGYIIRRLENDSQFEKLYQNLTADKQTVQEAERLFGYACFTEDAREKIAVLDSLIDFVPRQVKQ